MDGAVYSIVCGSRVWWETQRVVVAQTCFCGRCLCYRCPFCTAEYHASCRCAESRVPLPGLLTSALLTYRNGNGQNKYRSEYLLACLTRPVSKAIRRENGQNALQRPMGGALAGGRLLRCKPDLRHHRVAFVLRENARAGLCMRLACLHLPHCLLLLFLLLYLQYITSPFPHLRHERRPRYLSAEYEPTGA